MSDELLPDLLAAVEQQIHSPQTPCVSLALQRLLDAGMDETLAMRRIAGCLAKEVDEVLRLKRGFDEAAYRAALDALPLEE